MKLKLDFVTNSSSTSYILVDIPKNFTSYINPKIIEEAYNKLGDYEKDEYSLDDVIVEMNKLANGEKTYSWMFHELSEMLEELGFYVDTINVEDGGGDGGYTKNIYGLTIKEVVSTIKDMLPDY